MRSIRLGVLAFAAAFLTSACDAARPVEGALGAPHPAGFVDQHAEAALADLSSCKACHGTDFSGGEAAVSCTSCHGLVGFADWQTNCTFCHGARTPGWTTADSLLLVAPPRGARGETQPSQAAVGAHQQHLGRDVALSISAPVACSECHAVPADLSHVTGQTAALTFGPLATQGGLTPTYAGGSCSATYCHGATLAGGANTTPAWTGTVSCGDCHGLPPGTGRHASAHHVGLTCAQCHGTVATDTTTPGLQPAALALHVNGAKDVSLSVSGTWDPVTKTCSSVACHTALPDVRIW